MSHSSEFFPESSVKSLLGLKGWFGDVATDVVSYVLGINRMNRLFRPLDGLTGFDFADAALERLDVKPLVSDEDLAYIPATGPVIICSNHPYGCIDGIMMMSVIGKIRPDVRFMTNYILSQIPSLQELFIAVNPFEKGGPSSVSGVKAALEHVLGGGALVIFPAGEVSSDCNPQHIIRDRDWERGAMRLIKKAGAPVVPAFFEGTNSKFFHLIGHIHPILRTARLPKEMLNKSGRRIHLKFGKAVKPVEFASYHTPEELGAYLRNRSYALEGFLYRDDHPVPVKQKAPIEPHVDPDILRAELAGLGSNLLYKEAGYTCYLSRYEDIPNIIKEIGVCREETFRRNGEGTGKSTDLDEFDRYYLHLHLWNDENEELVGAYRVGIGDEIMKEKGIGGFYSDLFFHFKEPFGKTLAKSIELGRSFIVSKYQVVPNALKMLLNNGVGRLKGLYPDMKYFIGAASLSSDIPLMFSSLTVEYFKKTRTDKEFCGLVQPDIPFVPEFNRVDVGALHLEALSIDRFDKTLSHLSCGKFRVPPLVRAYAKANCTFIGFNVDPDFNYCVDSLVLVDLDDIE